MKIATIRSTNQSDFTEKINNFIKDKKVIDIKYDTTTAIQGIKNEINCIICDSAMIIYDE